jgi:single-stranded-DNA-specific exonuclease
MKADRIWETVACDEGPVETLSRELGVSPVTARLLCIRGFGALDDARRFLSPRLEDLHDPFRLADMGPAVERILRAIEAKDRIAIHGDYDVDGVTSTVILRRALELLGADVVHFIPERFRDGYGLQRATIDRLHQDGARLVISVDCGIRAAEAATRARDLGMDLIITDHHEPDSELPRALAVINPKRHDCGYPDKNLAGVGVALKLVQALCGRTGHANWMPAFVKVAAIGTLADVVPLTGENRVIAKLGLGMLSKGPHKVGLRSLLDACGLSGREIDSYHIGFVVAPRVNAAGRGARPTSPPACRSPPTRRWGRRRAGGAVERGESAAAAGRSRDRRAGEEDRRDGPRRGLPHRPRCRRRRVASRRHRHRRVKAR